MEINRETLKGYVDFFILLVLKDKNTYGYELCKLLKNETGLDIKDSTVYVCLKRLEEKKMIESYWEESKDFYNKRKYYNITNEGVKNLELKIEEWQFIQNILRKFLNKG